VQRTPLRPDRPLARPSAHPLYSSRRASRSREPRPAPVPPPRLCTRSSPLTPCSSASAWARTASSARSSRGAVRPAMTPPGSVLIGARCDATPEYCSEEGDERELSELRIEGEAANLLRKPSYFLGHSGQSTHTRRSQRASSPARRPCVGAAQLWALNRQRQPPAAVAGLGKRVLKASRPMEGRHIERTCCRSDFLPARRKRGQVTWSTFNFYRTQGRCRNGAVEIMTTGYKKHPSF
jgi:hypothetical protein